MHLEMFTPKWAEPLLYPSRYKAAYGGRGSGKSHFFAELAVERALLDPDFSLVGIREVQKSIAWSVKRLIEIKIKHYKLDKYFIIQHDKIKNARGDGVFVFVGMNDHNSDSIKSFADFKCAWVEEASSLSEKSLELLRPTIRASNSELWFSWNPNLPSDAVDKLFRTARRPADSIVVSCNYNDNPFLPDAMHTEIEECKKFDLGRFNHIWMGGYDIEQKGNILLSYSALQKAQTATSVLNYEQNGFCYAGLDVNDGGNDPAAYAVRQSSYLHVAEEIKEETGFDIAATALRKTEKYNIVRCYYDAIGVGASITSEFKRLNKRLTFIPEPFRANAKVKCPKVLYDKKTSNECFFFKLKDQAWWNLRLRLDNTMRALNGDNVDLDRCLFLPENADDKLLMELAQIEYSSDTNDRLRIDKKPTGTESPNLADAVMMSFTRDLIYGLRVNK